VVASETSTAAHTFLQRNLCSLATLVCSSTATTSTQGTKTDKRSKNTCYNKEMCFTSAVQATMRCWRGGEYVSTCEGVIWDLGEVRHYRGGGVVWRHCARFLRVPCVRWYCTCKYPEPRWQKIEQHPWTLKGKVGGKQMKNVKERS